MESHKAGFPPFPHSVEIPSGLPHSHGLDDEIRYLEATEMTQRFKPYHRKGLVTDVPGPKCNGCSGTLIPISGSDGSLANLRDLDGIRKYTHTSTTQSRS
jgi:hypothetical protein